MSLFIRNSTPNTVYVAIGYPNEGCSLFRAKRGWYAIRPGGVAQVYGGRVAGRFFYLYAEDDFGHVWGGSAEFTDIPNTAFDMCWIAACRPCRRLGFIRYYFRQNNPLIPQLPVDGTINLTLSANQRTSKSPNVRTVLPTKRKLNFRKYRHGIINKSKSQ